MKTVTVISDTHGNRRVFGKLGRVLAECDLIIHLGDTSADGTALVTEYGGKAHLLNGNCDSPAFGCDEEVIEVENVKIFACHGHRYSVKSTLSKLAARAEELGCGLALYGHTHLASECEIGGVTLLNPGHCSRYGGNSYLYIVINGNKFTYKIVGLG